MYIETESQCYPQLNKHNTRNVYRDRESVLSAAGQTANNKVHINIISSNTTDFVQKSNLNTHDKTLGIWGNDKNDYKQFKPHESK